MSRRRNRSLAPLALLAALLGAAWLGWQATEAAPAPVARPADAGPPVRGLSLRLEVSPPAFNFERPGRFSLALTNHTGRPLTFPEVAASVSDGHGGSVSYVARFPDGEAVRLSEDLIVTAVGDLASHFGPLRVGVDGARHTKDLATFLMGNDDFRRAFRANHRFCPTAIVEGIGLRSNTVFLNGKFDLSAGHDPVADAKAYRPGKKDQGYAAPRERPAAGDDDS